MNAMVKLQNYLPGLRPLYRLRSGYLRSAEFTAIGIALLAIIGVSYLFFEVLGERNQKINSLYTESNSLHRQIDQANNQNIIGGQKVGSTQEALDKLEEFNNRFLKDRLQGRLIVIDEINNLVRKNNLNLQSSISFRPIEDADEVEALKQKNPTKVRRNKTEKVDIYPGMRATFAVNGTYENFRKFLHDMESNKLFLIIESLGLQMPEGQQMLVRNGQNFAQPRNVPGQAVEGLSIQLDLKFYFRKQVNATN